LACLRELLLHRPGGRMLVRALAASAEADDRSEAARVIRDFAEVQPTVVDQDVISWLANDPGPGGARDRLEGIRPRRVAG
jgi:hypothetical protein